MFAPFPPLTLWQSARWSSMSQVKGLSLSAITGYNISLRACLLAGGLAVTRDFCPGLQLIFEACRALAHVRVEIMLSLLKNKLNSCA